MPIESFYALIIAFVVLLAWHIRTEMRLRRILRGKNAVTLEDTIASLDKDIALLKQFETHMNAYCLNLENRVTRSIQSVDMIRFNPFKGTGSGGNQSFVISLLNEKGDGLIISSLHHREGMSVFSKSISGFTSSHELTEEEVQALEGATKKLKQ